MLDFYISIKQVRNQRFNINPKPRITLSWTDQRQPADTPTTSVTAFLIHETGCEASRFTESHLLSLSCLPDTQFFQTFSITSALIVHHLLFSLWPTPQICHLLFTSSFSSTLLLSKSNTRLSSSTVIVPRLSIIPFLSNIHSRCLTNRRCSVGLQRDVLILWLLSRDVWDNTKFSLFPDLESA